MNLIRRLVYLSATCGLLVTSGCAFTHVVTASILMAPGSAWAWGNNAYGQLGDGGTSSSSKPVPVSMPDGVSFAAIASGGDPEGFSLAVDTSGHAWGWGYNACGELGNGSTANSYTPTPVRTPVGVKLTAISAGGDDGLSSCSGFGLALDTLGRAWAWGHNANGQLGNGSTVDSTIPLAVAMPGGVSFTGVAAGGYVSYGLDRKGKAWAWGSGMLGDLGDGGTGDSVIPVAVSMPTSIAFTHIAAGCCGFALALDKLGNAWAWGDNTSGQLGDGSSTGPQTCSPSNSPCSMVPVAVTMPPSGTFIDIAAGFGRFSLALDRNGNAWSWGANSFGELGVGVSSGPQSCADLPCSTTPVAVMMPSGVAFKKIAGGYGHSLAIDSTGRGWAWGYNADGELGNGTTVGPDQCGGSSCSTIPVSVLMPTGVTFSEISGNGIPADSLALTPQPQPLCALHSLPSIVEAGSTSSSVVDIVRIACRAVFSGNTVTINAAELDNGCHGTLSWEDPASKTTGSRGQFSVTLDANGNAAAALWGGPSCAATTYPLSGTLSVPPFTTAETTFTVRPPKNTKNGITARPNSEVEDSFTSSVATAIQVELPAVQSGRSVSVNSQGLYDRCAGNLNWIGVDGVVLASRAADATVTLDSNGNAFVVAIGGPSCVPGTSTVQGNLVTAPYTTFSNSFNILSPRVFCSPTRCT